MIEIPEIIGTYQIQKQIIIYLIQILKQNIQEIKTQPSNNKLTKSNLRFQIIQINLF